MRWGSVPIPYRIIPASATLGQFARCRFLPNILLPHLHAAVFRDDPPPVFHPRQEVD